MVSREPGEWRTGWPILAVAMCGISFGIPFVINNAGLFIGPMQRETGWPRAALSFGPMIGILYALMLPVMGNYMERIRLKWLAEVGLGMVATGLLGLALVPLHPIFFAVLILYFAVAGTISGNVIYCRAIAPYFRRSPGTAIALLLSAVSLVSAAGQPIIAALVATWGWRVGLAAMGAAVLLCGLLPIMVFLPAPPKPEDGARTATAPRGNWRTLVRDGRFWRTATIFTLAATAIGGFVSQVQPIMLDRGFSLTDAGLITSVFLAFTAVGRLLAGILFDHLSPPIVAASVFGLSGIGAAMLLLGAGQHGAALTPLLIAMALIGLSQGAEGDFMALFTLRSCRIEDFSFLFACMVTLVSIGFALGGLGFALCRDWTGSYELAIGMSALFFAVSALAVGTYKLPVEG